MRKSIRRAMVALALTPIVSMPTVAFAAGTGSGGTTTATTPAPPGSASAVAAEVNGVVAVGKTTAHAGSGGAGSSADAIDVLGHRVAGGDQNGVGSSSGNVVGTGDTPVGDAEVAPWSDKVTAGGGGYQSAAEAALAHASLGGVAEAWVLHSQSSAAWSPGQSRGDSQSDGAEVSALSMLDIKVLHSEAHSSGNSSSALVVVNGNEIGSSSDANGMCAVDASPLIDLVCLTAEGGSGAGGVTSSDASVVKATIGGGAMSGTVSGTSSQGGTAVTGTPLPKDRPPTSTGAQRSGGPLPHTGPSASGPQGSSLPFTGSDTGRLVVLAVAFSALGGAMTAFARRRRSLPLFG